MVFFKQIKKNNSLANLIQKNGMNKIFNEEEFRWILEFERERADRGKHQFSLIVFDETLCQVKFSTIQQLLDKITQRLRDIDNVGWLKGKNICVILPYTPKEGANQLVKNICESLDYSIPKSRYTVYTYPTDGTYSVENSIGYSPSKQI